MRLTSLILAIFLLLACDEVPPVVTGAQPGSGPGSTSVDDQQRQVLIEEFTGIRCVNCPAGAAAIEDLLAIHGERLVAVSIHAGFFAKPPHNGSTEDFITPEGDQLLSFLEEPLGYPTAVINREELNGSLQQGSGDWAGSIAEQLQQEPQVKIALTTDYNETSGQLKIVSTLFGQDNLTGGDNLALSVLLIENGVVDPQTTPQGIQDDYVHKHVLREAVTGALGDPLTETLAPGTQIEVEHELILDAAYKADQTHVVAFVHRASGSKEVLQAIEADVIDN